MKPEVDVPLDLPRLVMRRAVVVAAVAWLAALALGLLRATNDIDQETGSALNLAQVNARLAHSASLDDRRVVEELKALERSTPLRHLSLTVRDADGAVVLAPADAPTVASPLSWLVSLHRSLLPSSAQPQSVSWPLARAAARPWQVTWTASPESERIEALESLAGALVVVALGAAALLLAMHVNVRRAFRPMQGLLEAIAALRRNDPKPLRELASMPVQELQAVRNALRELGAALEGAEEERRTLSQKVLTLQEDERRRIARELHDEFGQRLTALRADAAWLSQRLAADAQALRVVAGVSEQCELLQRDVRALTARLQPLAAERGEPLHLLRLQRLLEQLVSAWNASPGRSPRVELDLAATDRAGRAQPWPDAARAQALHLPHEFALAVYRISQEALTNAARHARATRVQLRIVLAQTDAGTRLCWRVSDDGVGLEGLDSALQRGNGLAGMRERVWAFGADLQVGRGAAQSHGGAGLVLEAMFELPAAGARIGDDHVVG